MKKNTDVHLLHEAEKIVHALGKMFAPFCEVVLHDLRNPDHAIVAIENNFSERKVGDATTNLGLERVLNTNTPDVIQNYQNILPDGRILKSTSISIRNDSGECIGSICLNFDTTHFGQFASQMSQFIATEDLIAFPKEQLRSLSQQEIKEAVIAFATSKNTTPQRLNPTQRKELLSQLEQQGFLGLRNAISTIADLLSVTRPTIYNSLKA